ncbi:MAG: Abi family protein [Bacteroidaceae bacterium]|nr:Abi family protein [Bacteroidaceae bacterium]
MEYNKVFFEKVFSDKRMERYFALYPDNEDKAIKHYQSNLQLTEAFYTSLSVLEVALRNALSRELETMTGREDWYAVFPNTPGLTNLNRYVTQATKQIAGRHEQITPSKIVAELTLGFWVSLLNTEYERLLWKDLRRAFPYLPKKERQRKKVSAPLNRFRAFRNRVFHNESICWNIRRVQEIHNELILLLEWINKDLPKWLKDIDRFDDVQMKIKEKMGWS